MDIESVVKGAAALVQVGDDGGLDQVSISEDGEKLKSSLRSREQVVWMWKTRIRMEPITMPKLRVRRNLQTLQTGPQRNYLWLREGLCKRK